MTRIRSDTLSWMKNDVLPFVSMLVITCLDMSALTIAKAAMNDGMKSIVYVVYHGALGTLILLPFFILHTFRNVGRLQPTLRILFRFSILGLLGACLFQIPWYIGVAYSSPTMASAISNLAPATTFLLAVVFRMEKIDIKRSSSQAKLLGTIIAISGAMVFTFYQGREIFHTTLSPDSPNDQLLLSQSPDWIFGGLILFVGGIAGCMWSVLQTATAREFPDQLTIVFYLCLFGMIECIPVSLFLEPNPSAWVLRPGIGMIAVVFGAVYSIVIRLNALTWCLEKKGPVFVALFSPFSIAISLVMGVAFLGDSLYLGSAIGALTIAVGFYSVMWGQAKEKKQSLVTIAEDLVVSDEPESSNQTALLLSSTHESKC